MRPFVLLHIVLSGKGLVADGTVHTLFASVLLAMTRGMPGCGESGSTVMRGSIRTRIFVLLDW